jgi:hypothetical protein
VANCRFYGTYFLRGVEFTASVNGLSWFIAYNRQALERFAEDKPEFLDRFIKNRIVLRDVVIEGEYYPDVVRELKTATGYKVMNGYRLLVMDFPVLAENSIPIGRVVFVKDLTPILRDVLTTPFVFFGYTVALVMVLSTVLLLLFNRIVRDVVFLREVTTKFKESDFSDIPKMSELLRKEKSRDELFYLKRSVLTMAQELEALISQLQSEKDKLEELAYTDALTGLNNRRLFMEEAKRMLEYARRYREPASLLMMDIDNIIPGSPDFDIGGNYFKDRFDTDPWLLKYKKQQVDGPFWNRASLNTDYSLIDIPVFVIGGYYDGYRDIVPRMAQNADVPYKALLGPWNHSFPHSAYPEPAIEWREMAVRWLDHWMKGKDTGILNEPSVYYYQRDWHEPGQDLTYIPGRWYASAQWPETRLCASTIF